MGERVSIQFQKLERYGNQDPVKEKSVVLFHHWGAEDFPELALDWVRDFREKAKNQAVSRVSDPISRMEPQTLMVQFIGYLANTGYKSHRYENYEIDNLNKLRDLIKKNQLSGLNVTIPFKQKIIKHLDEIESNAREINSVNTIKVENNKLIGYNSDIQGFENSFIPIIGKRHKAIVLGNGGASKAVQFVLKKNKIKFIIVSRSGKKKFEDITNSDIISYQIIINTTPLGMYPDINTYPNIPYHVLSSNHLIYDLVYNPEETIFIKKAKEKNCIVINGLEMLINQANISWEIWQK